MKTTPLIHMMTGNDVAEMLKIKPETVRSKLCRKKAGASTPPFPEPLGKFAGAWLWDRRAVQRFLNEEKGRRESAGPIR